MPLLARVASLRRARAAVTLGRDMGVGVTCSRRAKAAVLAASIGLVGCYESHGLSGAGSGGSGRGSDAASGPGGGGAVVAIAGHGIYNCALRDDGRVLCWGQQRGGTAEPGLLTATEVPLAPATAVMVGWEQGCAVHADGSMSCWGRWVPDADWASDPVLVAGLANVVDGDGGPHRTCVRHTDGGASCWGDNHYGAVGDGSFDPRPSPTPISGLTGVRSIQTGNAHSCALDERGTVHCWGDNGRGQLGFGRTGESSPTPGAVEGLTSVAEIAVGLYHSCARFGDGTVACWGGNLWGALGDGTSEDRARPTRVPGLSGVVALAAGDFLTCAAVEAGTVSCWGGIFADRPETLHPRRVDGLDDVVALSAGSRHACALRGDGSVWCWGWNIAGNLGNGRSDNAWTDTVYRVSGL